MKKLIKCVCIFALIFINVYMHLFSYNNTLMDILIILFTSLFCFISGKESYKDTFNTIKYIIIYIFWNMNYLVFVRHFSSLDGIINTLLLKTVFIDILAVLAFSNILLIICNRKKFINIILSFIFLILFIFLKNNIFIYTSFFLIGNTLSIKDIIGIKTNIFKIIDYVNIGILISHRLVLFLLIDSKVISSSISDFIGALVLIYVIGIAISYYIKVIPIVRDII